MNSVIIRGAEDTLVNRLLLFDAWHMRFRELKLRKNPQCPICGANPTVRELIDYEEFCGLRSQPKQRHHNRKGWKRSPPVT